jgi:hypothetical protein
MHKMLLLAAAALVAACTPAERGAARTVNDVARVACEAAFGEELPQGLTVEDLCRAQEDLQPFIDAILGARQTVGERHGAKAPE